MTGSNTSPDGFEGAAEADILEVPVGWCSIFFSHFSTEGTFLALLRGTALLQRLLAYNRNSNLNLGVMNFMKLRIFPLNTRPPARAARGQPVLRPAQCDKIASDKQWKFNLSVRSNKS